MPAQFDYTNIRATALALVKKFGRNTLMHIDRTVEATAADPTKPWRVGTGTILQFPFYGVCLGAGIPRRSDVVYDSQQVFFIPGDIRETAALTDPLTLCGEMTLNDRVHVNSKIYSIVGIQDIEMEDDQSMLFIVRGKAWPNIQMQPAMAPV